MFHSNFKYYTFLQINNSDLWLYTLRDTLCITVIFYIHNLDIINTQIKLKGNVQGLIFLFPYHICKIQRAITCV